MPSHGMASAFAVMMAPRASILFAITLLCPPAVRAQAPQVQIEQARERTKLPAGTAGSTAGFEDFPETTADDASDAKATSQREDRALAFSGFAEIAAFATDNVALTKHAREDDRYLVATTAASLTRRFCPQIQADATVRAAAYRYNRFPGLDFQTIDLSVGVTWIPPKLGGTEIEVRYTFSDFTTRHGDEFYSDHAILLGAQKVYRFSAAQAIYGGLNAQWGWSDPKSAHRDEYSVFAGYRLQATRSIDADLNYRYSRYVYTDSDGRQDNNQIVSLTWRYAPVDWAAVSLTSYFSWNRSTQSAFDYEALNAGLALQFSVRF